MKFHLAKKAVPHTKNSSKGLRGVVLGDRVFELPMILVH